MTGYINLKIEIEILAVQKLMREMAHTLGMTVEEFNKRLEGEKAFTLKEMATLQKEYFPNLPIEHLGNGINIREAV